MSATTNHLGFSLIFRHVPAACLIVGTDAPGYTILDVNEAYLLATKSRRESLIGQSVFSVFPDNPGDAASNNTSRSAWSFGEAIRTGETHILANYRYDIPVPGTERFEERYWTATNTPIKDESGKVIYLLHSPADVTEYNRLATNEAASIAELRSHRLQLEVAEERARLAMASSGLGMFDVNFDTGELVTSPQFDLIFGFDEPRPYEDYKLAIHPDDRELRLEAHRESMVSGRLFYEARVAPPSGPERWIRAEGKVFFDVNGKGLRLLGTVLDITSERMAAVEQQKLISLADNSVDLMSILDLNGVNSYINQAGRNMLGFVSEEDVKRIPVSDLHAPEEYDRVRTEILPAVIRTGRWSGMMMVRHIYTGEVFPVFNNCIRIDDPVTGKPVAIGAVMRDMRPELTAKKALADSEQLLRNITTAAPTALWMTNAALEMVYINQTWLKWTNSHYTDNMKGGWLHYLHVDDREKVIDRFRSVNGRTNFYDVDFRIIHADGTVHWCTASGQPQYDDNGEFTGYIGACVDITEQKSLQQQKDDFIGIASHELKTPVTSIKGYTQLLEQMLTDKGDLREAALMQRMDKQVNRLTNLIGDLLDVTKITAGKLQFNETVFDFNPMVRELVEDLQRTTVRHTLVEHYEEAGFVYADKDRIGQVITNLISNAIKYSPGSDEIVIRTCRQDNHIILSVEDFGIGIAREKLERVFEQFYRVGGEAQQSFPGLGLGLFISSEIIKRETGKIWVTSEPGKGSTFSFQLPILD
ncbi:MAG: PAS domain S-box protein [Chitinophagaceae bacterium]|nr:MAG: PAS domain S-box protein [Chitinophagaceae bacterium]